RGVEIPVEADRLGFLQLRPTPGGEADILLEYDLTTEKKLTAAISVLAWLLSVAGSLARRSRQATPAAGV
ncbi:MAG: hypothetical protein JNK48_09980, partial [Bryobacterales bacterium]|nr:hypothetical protein [Bryobacterales bacterium]